MATQSKTIFTCLSLIIIPYLTWSICPGLYEGTPPDSEAPIPPLDLYNEYLAELDIEAVIDDLEDLLTDSQECWPADTFNGVSSYAGLFIRLAWHCSGTFRNTDGAGGCSGGRQRFWPEASWDDNTNLDKARALLAPIKNKYGIGLSWGDLMTFAGTAAIKHGGGPLDSICAGRIDDGDGSLSEPLGPGPEAPPCPIEGDCQAPLGTSTIGLIYVNPEGFMGEPDPVKSASQIRDIFGRMDWNDSETVALIGGGHAFGKSHGACPAGAGLPPNLAPLNPWPGLCGTGKGEDTYTSGIEGQWTANPLIWDNQYFTQLVQYKNGEVEYTLGKGSGDKYQWTNSQNGYMMMTTDIALVKDDDFYAIVEEYATNIDSLNVAFAAAWKKLTEEGGTWAKNKKCITYSNQKTSTNHTNINDTIVYA